MRVLRKFGGWFLVIAVCIAVGIIYWGHTRLGFGWLTVHTFTQSADGQRVEAQIQPLKVAAKQPGVPWPYTWLDFFFLGKGQHRPGPLELRASFDHFQTSTNAIQIAEGKTNIVDLVLVPKPKTITIQGLPAGARTRVSLLQGPTSVEIKSQVDGATQVVHNTRVGEPYVFEASADGYRTRKFTLLNTNPIADLVARVELERLAGAIQVELTVSGAPEQAALGQVLTTAIVSVDGTPAQLHQPVPVLATNHNVTAEHPDYFPASLQVAVEDGQTNRVKLNLFPRPAVVRLVLPKEVLHYEVLDAQLRLLSTNSPVLLPPGTNQLIWGKAEEYQNISNTFVVQPNQRLDWNIELLPAYSGERQEAIRRLDELMTEETVALLDEQDPANWTTLKQDIPKAMAYELAPREALPLLRQIETELSALIDKAKRAQRLKEAHAQLDSDVNQAIAAKEFASGIRSLDVFEQTNGVSPATKALRTKLLEAQIGYHRQLVSNLIQTNAFKEAWAQAKASGQALAGDFPNEFEQSVIIGHSNEVRRLTTQKDFQGARQKVEEVKTLFALNDMERFLRESEDAHKRQMAQSKIVDHLKAGESGAAWRDYQSYVKTNGNLLEESTYQAGLYECFSKQVADARNDYDKGLAQKAVDEFKRFGGSQDGQNRLAEKMKNWPKKPSIRRRVPGYPGG